MKAPGESLLPRVFNSKVRCKLIIKPLTLILFLSLIQGCSSSKITENAPPTGPEYVGWLPKTFSSPPTEAVLPAPKELWWQDFHSQELNQLVALALTNNYDLRIAVARVAQSRAQIDSVKAAQSPTVDVTGGYQRQAPFPAVGSAASKADWYSQGTWQIGAMVNYEVDLWGRKGFNTDAAYAQAVASEFYKEAVALTLVGDVTATYFQVVSTDERIEVGERNLETIYGISRGLQQRVSKGDATLIELSQQLILQSNTEALVTSLKLQRERAFNRLAALLGTTASSLKIQAKSIQNLSIPIASAGLPSDLLCRRPDIKRAEATLVAAQADLYAARANLFPSFVLSGQGGYGSYMLSTLTSPQSLFYNVSSNLVTHVFDGGKRKADIEIAQAKNIELLEGYAGTVIASMRDVEEALSSVVMTDKSYQTLSQSRARGKQLAAMTSKVVELGGMDYMQLFEIQRSVLAAEDAAISARLDQLRASVDLFKSIGGGLKLGQSPCYGGGKLPKPDASWIEAARKLDASNGSMEAVNALNGVSSEAAVKP